MAPKTSSFSFFVLKENGTHLCTKHGMQATTPTCNASLQVYKDFLHKQHHHHLLHHFPENNWIAILIQLSIHILIPFPVFF